MSITLRAKDPDNDATYELNLWERLVRQAYRSSDFSVAAIARPPRDSGLYLECTTAGRTGELYPPSYPRVAGETITDGSVVWTARHPSSVTPPTISSVTYVMPTGLTLVSQSESDHVATFTVSGGVDGTAYEIVARVVPSTGPTRDITLDLSVAEQ